MKAMKDINAANVALRGHVTAKDYEAIAADAAALTGPLTVGAKFWEARKDAEAAGWATGAAKAAADLETAAKAKNDDGIAAAQKTIGASCQTCHTAHRTKMPDGTYEIK
jgi:cytochrome c556